ERPQGALRGRRSPGRRRRRLLCRSRARESRARLGGAPRPGRDVRRQLALATHEPRGLRGSRDDAMSSTIDVRPVIMAGGSGTRLWPLSRAQYPKQFLVLQGNRSLFQEAAGRLKELTATDLRVGTPYVVGNEEHRFLVLDQLREVGLEAATVLLEPAARN